MNALKIKHVMLLLIVLVQLLSANLGANPTGGSHSLSSLTITDHHNGTATISGTITGSAFVFVRWGNENGGSCGWGCENDWDHEVLKGFLEDEGYSELATGLSAGITYYAQGYSWDGYEVYTAVVPFTIDLTPEVEVAQTTLNVDEDAGTINVQFNLAFAAPSGGSTINYAIADGTADKFTDYFYYLTGSCVIPQGSNSGSVEISIIDNQLKEDTEDFTFEITGATGADVGGDDTTTINIADNDDSPLWAFAGPDHYIDSSDGGFAFHLMGKIPQNDDLIEGSVTYSWSKISGPGGVTIDDNNSPDTLVEFTNDGTYVFRLEAVDEASPTPNESEDTVTIVVQDDPPWSDAMGTVLAPINYYTTMNSWYEANVAGTVNPGHGMPMKNAYDSSYNGGATDAFVAKFSPEGVLQWSTCLGGSGDEFVSRIAVDFMDNVYVAGYTTSSDFPVTSGKYDNTHNGNYDGYIAVFDKQGNFKWASFIGGSGADTFSDIAIKANGNILLAGSATSSGLQVGGSAASYSANWDGFATEMKHDGSGLVWLTYIGGVNYDASTGIGEMSNGNAAICTWYNFNSSFQAGAVRVRVISSSGGTVSTTDVDGTTGGTYSDFPRDLAFDSNGNFYVIGKTDSTDLISGKTHNGGTWDAFVLKFNSVAVYSSSDSDYLGTSDEDQLAGVSVSDDNAIYAAGDHTAGSDSQFWYLKLNSNGTVALDKTYEPASNRVVDCYYSMPAADLWFMNQ